MASTKLADDYADFLSLKPPIETIFEAKAKATNAGIYM